MKSLWIKLLWLFKVVLGKSNWDNDLFKKWVKNILQDKLEKFAFHYEGKVEDKLHEIKGEAIMLLLKCPFPLPRDLKQQISCYHFKFRKRYSINYQINELCDFIIKLYDKVF
jgi:hypothetical protein